MSNKTARSCVFVILVMFLCSFCRASEKLKLQCDFDESDEYQVHTNATLYSSTSRGDGNFYFTEQNLKLFLNYKVNSVDSNGAAWFEIAFNDVKFSLVQKLKGCLENLRDVHYDSSKDAFPETGEAQAWAALVDESFSIKLRPAGDVEEVKGLSRLQKNVLEKIPDSPQKENTCAGIRSYLKEKNIRQTFSQPFIAFDKPLAVGETFNDKQNWSMYGVIVNKNINLKNREKRIVFLEYEGDIKPDPNAVPFYTKPDKIRYSLAGDTSGRLKVLEATGVILEAITTTNMSGVMTVEYHDSNCPPANWFLSISGNSKVKVHPANLPEIIEP